MNKNIWISGEIDGDVYDHWFEARKEVETEIGSAINSLYYGEGFGGLALIPILRAVDDPIYHEVRRYTKKDRLFEFRLKISHAAFKAADPLGHRKLIVEMILRAVAEARKKKVKDVDYDKLEADIQNVAASRGWL